MRWWCENLKSRSEGRTRVHVKMTAVEVMRNCRPSQ